MSSKLDPSNFKEKAAYKVLSTFSGKDLNQTKHEKLREKRKKTIQSYKESGIFNKPYSEQIVADLVYLCLQEAELIDGFEPDLLIVSREQYLQMFDIPVSQGIGGNEFIPMNGVIDTAAPLSYKPDDKEIEVTYSDAAESMLLVSSEEL